MKLEKEQIDHIKSAFQKMQTKEDLLKLLNYAKPIIYGEKTVEFNLGQLTYYSIPNKSNLRYKTFIVKKKSGGDRSIHAPVKGLKAIQKTLALIIQCVFEPHRAATGFVKEKSIVDNARVHVGNRYIYNIDLKDFFQSIDQPRVWKCLQLSPFNLINDDSNTKIKKNKSNTIKHVTDLGEVLFYKFTNNELKFIEPIGDYFEYRKRIEESVLNNLKKYVDKDKKNDEAYLVGLFFQKFEVELYKEIYAHYNTEPILTRVNKQINQNRLNLAGLIANISCTEMEVERNNNGHWEKIKKDVLPQGAPTSPVLTNVVCQRLDFLLTAVAKRFGLRYSRYADDITFSSLHNVYQENSPFIKEIRRIIENQGFYINESKTRLQVDGIRKTVTGLLVNDKVNVQKRYIKQIRMWLYLWERYGYVKAYSLFKSDYLMDKGHTKKGTPDFINVLDGKLNYLAMVKGKSDSTYVKLKQRFDNLVQEGTILEKVLVEWENNGIENAIDVYKKSK